MEELRRAGERLGKFELEKRQAISMEHFGKAKLKKAQMDDYREQVYSFLEIPVLLELNGVSAKCKANSNLACSIFWESCARPFFALTNCVARAGCGPRAQN
jgi:hypothetical protein